MGRILQIGVAWTIVMATICGSVLAQGVGQGKSYKGPTGLQLYSLREMFKEKGVTPTLDLVQKWGFKYVEVAGMFSLIRILRRFDGLLPG